MSDPQTTPFRALLEGPSLGGIIASRLEQCERYGHTPESDSNVPVDTLAQQAVSYSHGPRDHAIPGDRQNLAAALRGAERAAALWWAVADRARAEIEKQKKERAA